MQKKGRGGERIKNKKDVFKTEVWNGSGLISAVQN